MILSHQPSSVRTHPATGDVIQSGFGPVARPLGMIQVDASATRTKAASGVAGLQLLPISDDIAAQALPHNCRPRSVFSLRTDTLDHFRIADHSGVKYRRSLP